MKIYYSKEGLYKEIHRIKEFMGIHPDAYNIDLIDYCVKRGVIIQSVPFKTYGLRGMAVIGNEDEEDIILLNSNHSKIEQNFYCVHEIVHLCLHRTCGHNVFNCFENIKENKNSYLEWHANEGAAEFFVPYKILLPIIKEKIGLSTDYNVIETAKYEIAELFNVPDTVITYRLENLKYEIYQYINGTPLESIKILSLKQQEKQKIYTQSLNSIANNDLERHFRAWISMQ